MERRFETPGEPQLRVRNPSGLVSLETAETGETVVELEALRDDEVTRNAIENAVVEQRGTTIAVEIAGKSWGFLGRSPSVGIRIRAPFGAAFECTTASADVSATGRTGATTVKSASGDIVLEHVRGSLVVETASGDVRLAAVDGDAQLKTVSGDARVGIARAGIEVALVSGDLQVEEAHTSVTVNSVSGDQELRSVRDGKIRLQSVSGDLSVGVAPGTRVFIDASSTSGDVGSELDVTQAPGSTGSSGAAREANLRLKTISGDISIVRGAVPAGMV